MRKKQQDKFCWSTRDFVNEICPCLLAEHFFSGSVFKESVKFVGLWYFLWLFFFMFLWWTTWYPAHAKNYARKKCPTMIRVDEIFVMVCHHSSQMCHWGTRPLLRMVSPLWKNMYLCVCTIHTFQGWNYSLLFILSRVMCFHPWSDVTLPLMSIDEILEVIREWIRQFKELSNTYRWVQVNFNLSALL